MFLAFTLQQGFVRLVKADSILGITEDPDFPGDTLLETTFGSYQVNRPFLTMVQDLQTAGLLTDLR